MSDAQLHAASPFTAAADGLRVRVRLTPRAAADRIHGLAPEANGDVALKVAVTAAPESGKANASLIALLAREWRLPKSAITLAGGATDRRKLLHVAGDSRGLAGRLERWLADRLPGPGG